jgi:hypothetical protein
VACVFSLVYLPYLGTYLGWAFGYVLYEGGDRKERGNKGWWRREKGIGLKGMKGMARPPRPGEMDGSKYNGEI